jgi:hypothetical protein
MRGTTSLPPRRRKQAALDIITTTSPLRHHGGDADYSAMLIRSSTTSPHHYTYYHRRNYRSRKLGQTTTRSGGCFARGCIGCPSLLVIHLHWTKKKKSWVVTTFTAYHFFRLSELNSDSQSFNS